MKMELPDFLTKIKNSSPTLGKEYFWALEIWEGGVKSAIWTVEEEKVKVVALGSREVWQETADDFIAAVDKSFTTASERFSGEGEEPSKAIFSLPSGWLEEEKIIPSRQQLLQTLCEQLGLSPIGFVLLVDALNHHLQDVEGVPPTAILVNPQKNQVLLAILAVGKVLGVEEVARSENLANDVYEGLSRFKNLPSFPSRILLFNSEDMESVRQILLNFNWPQDLPFLHFPKIEILPQDFDITAVCLAGGSEVAKSLGFTLRKEIPPQTDLGFLPGQDIKEKIKEEPEVGEIPPPVETPPPQGEKETRWRSLVNTLKKKIKGFSLPSLPSFPGFPFGGLVVGGAVIFLVVIFLGFIWYLPKAEVVIYLTPKFKELSLALTIDPNQEVVEEKNLILPGRIAEVEVSGEKTTSPTGKKIVGEKSKGEVIIFNAGEEKTLPGGTILTGPGGLKFALDQLITVASGSAGQATQVKSGITAVNIGAEYNLASGSWFTVGNFSRFVLEAKNESSLAGGTSRQVQAVSEEDQKTLLTQLTEELGQKAKTDLLASLPPGRRLIEESISFKESLRNFNLGVGEEALSLNLALKIKGRALTFSEEEFLKLGEKQILVSAPVGYEVEKGALNWQFEVKEKKKDGSILFKVFLSANLLPQLEREEIIAKIQGRSLKEAQNYLSQLPDYSHSEIIVKPRLPAWFLFLPKIKKNIHLEIRSQ